jgi:hypothetical protein
LIATTTLGGKAGWTPATRLVVEARQPMDAESPTPFAGDLTWHTELSRYVVVAKVLARQQHDLRPHDIAMRRRILFAAGLQFGSLLLGEPDHERAAPWHDASSWLRRTLSCRHESVKIRHRI